MESSGTAAASSAAGSSFQRLVAGDRALRLSLTAGAVAYGLGLVATLPAKLVLQWAGAPKDTAASGTIWAGATAFSGQAVSWRVAPLRSLLALGLAADLRVEGDGTRLVGRATARPGSLVVRELKGSAGWSQIAAAAPALPFACETRAGVDIERLELGRTLRRASGEVTTGSALCTGGGAATTVPALRATVSPEGSAPSIRVIELTRPGAPLILATASPDGMRVEITATGAALLPAGAGLAGAVFESAPVTARPAS